MHKLHITKIIQENSFFFFFPRSNQYVSNSHSTGGGIDHNLSGILNLEFCGTLKPFSLSMAPSSTCHSSNR
ncbi:hypothetical protein ACOSQ3_008839 [Xanthoceras sorbifolium]